MNVYDFDGTIYNGDSTVDFYLFCLAGAPGLIGCLPRQLRGILSRRLGRMGDEEMKSLFFSFLCRVDTERAVLAFWEKRERRIFPWYREVMRADDVIISASPVFLLAPLCRRLGLREPIATPVDPVNGRLLGKNCKGEEKAACFAARFPGGKIDRFYSDSLTDLPMARLAEEAFFVKKGRVLPWKL